MTVDVNTLLLALCLTAFTASIAVFLTSRGNQSEGFLATGGMALLFMAMSVPTYLVFNHTFSVWIGALACSFLVIGVVMVHAAARQFRTDRLELGSASVMGASALLLILLPYANGYNGLSFALMNFAVGCILLMAATEFWQGRNENPALVSSTAGVLVLIALSYLACGVSILNSSPLVLTAPPDSIFEAVKRVLAIVGLTGLAALCIAINHQRLVYRHRTEALTDTLTGIANRRALFETLGDEDLPAETAAMIFDLDHFKRVNDTHGHQVGDRVIRRFVQVAKKHLRDKDSFFRLGGEEFVIVLAEAPISLAMSIAETIRHDFARQQIEVDGETFSVTVSVGVWADDDPAALDQALRHADRALYHAKHGGRNRSVSVAEAA